MTTNANKFGLRAAAQERSNRHAQRTPLPPRPEQTADLTELVEEAGEILASVGKSQRKAAQFKEFAEANGWEIALQPTDADLVEMIATRGPETIHQAWVGGVWQYDASTYTIADRTTKPRNASGAKKLMTRSQSEAEEELGKVASNTFFKRRSPEETATRRKARLPFTLEDDDETIMAALNGRKVRWLNRLSNSTEEAFVTKGGKHIRMVWVGEERVFQFCESGGTGFRAFRLSDVQRVR